MSATTEAAFESNIEAHLLSHGWVSVDPKGYDTTLGLFPDELFAFVQQTQPDEWAKLVKAHGGEAQARTKLLKAVTDALTQRGTLAVLREPVKSVGVKIQLCFFKPASQLNAQQAARYAANRVGGVRQLHHSESKPGDSLDLTLVINGIPVATAELKNQLTGQGLENAMRQYREDRNPFDLIFRERALVHFAVDPHQVAMTTKLAGADTVFLPFNQGSNGPGNTGGAGNPASDGYQTAYLWEEVWQRDAWLDLFGSFVHVEDKRVLFPRYHQWHAVKALLAATKDAGAGPNRLVQHSAGSGKSNTIAWTAHQLSRLHDSDNQQVFHKVVVVTDRLVLDKQLQATVSGLEQTPGTVVPITDDSKQLLDALTGNTARVVITTLQKFPVVIEIAKKLLADEGETSEVAGERFAIIVDEAHSSTGGDSITKLKTVLGSGDPLADAEAADAAAAGPDPEAELLASAENRGPKSNLSFFAFTATPKPRTLDIFGELAPDGHKRPFHTYSMRQAIAEGFILDVLANYVTYSTYYKLANSHPRNDPEFEKGKGKAALARFASLHPYMMDEKAEIIVEHFRQKTASRIDGHAKAMVVTRSRLHAVRTKQAIDRYIAQKGYDKGAHPMKALVAFSGTVIDPEAPELTFTEAGMNGFSETQLPKKFAGDDYQVLVVAEKYQTGFDQPLLHTMYVDKKLGGVAAVQTLSRLNRIHPGKDDTFVLDFANTHEEIKDAFEPFYEESFAQPTDPDVLVIMEYELMHAGVLSVDEMNAAVAALLSGDAAQQPVIYANLHPAVGRFVGLDDDDREAFRGRLDSFCRAYAFVAQIVPFTDIELERLFLYGRLLLLELPANESDPMPQLSKSVQLTHLRISVSGEGAIALQASEDAGVALPGEGKGAVTEPVKDKLSALIDLMNEKYGAKLDDGDRVLFDQQWVVVKGDSYLRSVAQNNDFSQYKLVLKDKFLKMLATRHGKNEALFDLVFVNPDVQEFVLDHLAETYHEFRREMSAS